jgi:hypothetical protein
MKDLTYTLLKSFAAGFAALLLLSTALFWGRFYCDRYLYGRMAQQSTCRSATISPSGILPAEIEKDPNVDIASSFHGYTEPDAAVIRTRLGIVDYFERRVPEARFMLSFYEYVNNGKTDLYFDKKSGLIVYQSERAKKTNDNKTEREEIKLYAGPEGISEKPTKELGRFYSPVRMQKEPIIYHSRDEMQTEYVRAVPITYDKKLRRFFKIDFDKREVKKGPEIDKNINFRPIQIGQPRKGEYLLSFWWSEPMIEIKREDKNEAEKRYGKIQKRIVTRFYPPGGQYVPFLDERGLIFLVDRDTLEIAGEGGYLPAPMSYFGSGKAARPNVARPKDLLAFMIEPVAIKPDGKYLGMGAAALSRDGASITVAVFDKEGKLLKMTNTVDGYFSYRDYDGDGIIESERYITQMDSSKAVFWGQPGSPLATVLRYLIENLQGPALNIASFFTADSFEASSGHRALFLVTNSFIGMKGRQAGVSFSWKFFGGLLLIAPSIILSVLLAWSVKRDALTKGLCKKERLCWIAGVLCFGLAGYISYRLCCKQAGLINCRNCGMSRRVDMDVCHRCGGSWLVPELEDPGWRVRDN